MIANLKHHWPEYLMEAALLGIFMMSASLFVTAIEHPGSPVRQAIANPMVRRMLTGLAMGLTAISLIYSPWGKQSGAHFNPSVTLAFFRLGKIDGADAGFYVLAQFAGGLAGIVSAAGILRMALAAPEVNYVATVPGPDGPSVAFLAEFGISLLQMTMVLVVSNMPGLARYTGLAAGTLVATYITLEAPLSGMSMNPARSFGPALIARHWKDLWVYFTAPPLGMLTAAYLYTRVKGRRQVACAKLHHDNDTRCIFRCRYRSLAVAEGSNQQVNQSTNQQILVSTNQHVPLASPLRRP